MYDRVCYRWKDVRGVNMRACIYSACVAVCLVSQAIAVDSPDFTKDVAPILTKYCTGCHNDTDREGKLSLESYGSLLKGGAKGRRDHAGAGRAQSADARADRARRSRKCRRRGREAPKPAEIEVLKNWIAAGAKGPSGAAADSATLVTPQVKLLAPPKLAINAVALSPRRQNARHRPPWRSGIAIAAERQAVLQR